MPRTKKTQAARQPEAPVVPEVSVDWRAIGPASPDPAVVLEAWLSLNGVPMRLLAFRVKRPYTAGWTDETGFEASPYGSQGQLLFDRDAYMAYLKATEALARADVDGPPEPPDPEDPVARRWVHAYQALHHGDHTDFACMMMRDGAPYYIVGFRGRPPGGPVPCLTVAPTPDDLAFGAFERTIRIDGVPCVVYAVCVRAENRLKGAWQPVARLPWAHEEHAHMLRWHDDVLPALDLLDAVTAPVLVDGGQAFVWLAAKSE